jgi:SAM-dependent methyltransferase
MAPVAFSCVVDNDPYLLAQCFIWLNCLMDVRRVPSEHIFVHHTAIDNLDFMNWLESCNVRRVPITPYDPRSPHCNKLRQLDTFADGRYGQVVLMDCDTAWVGDLPLPAGRPLAAKIVDFANPSEAVLADIFREAGLGAPDWVDVTFAQGNGRRRTDRNNCNGGLYIFEGAFIATLAPSWNKWARWCIEHRDRLGEFAVHVDQVSLALALRELGVSAQHLGVEWNYPLHLRGVPLPDIAPQILHFHRQFTPHFTLMPVGVAEPDKAVHMLNARIEGYLSGRFLNSLFWDLRYRVSPELGSGIGSRGEILAAKRKWLGYVLATFACRSVIDIGCGDLEVTRILPLKHYWGLDVSQQAIDLAKSKRPNWSFMRIDAARPPAIEGDAVLCLDVLIHQKEKEEFEGLVRQLVQGARKRLIVSGYEKPLADKAGIVAFHRPLSDALRSYGDFGEISIVGGYRDCSLIVADKRRATTTHPNDMSPHDFNHASTLTHRPDLLRCLADLSREIFGFYTKHFPRALEYPWVASRLEGLKPGSRVLDLGAGLNPLPLLFACGGISVECIDQHPVARVPPVDNTWNEWGFYDYARNHPLLRSHNVNALSFQPPAPLDAVYSVSVIEHMPRATWEGILERCRSWLKHLGRLVLTIDLIPDTDFLWNYAEGRLVEPPEAHGNITSFMDRLKALGFAPLETFVRRKIPQSRTDLLFVDCARVT